MAFLNFEYRMTISYSEPVDRCYFTIKGIPAEDFRQRRISYDISLIPPTKYSMNEDSFGNTQIIGSEPNPHSEFVYAIKGLVETYPVSISGGVNTSRVGMYKYPYGKCVPGDEIKAFAASISDEVDKCDSTKDKVTLIMSRLHDIMTYEKGSTEVETAAEDAFANRKGVCQDFAHILICLLRLFAIPARYVCGVIVGEGESHAWVEAVCDNNYVAFDPTFNQEVTDEYIKFGVGRDATDCAINRGVMWGGGDQTQEILVTVEKYY